MVKTFDVHYVLGKYSSHYCHSNATLNCTFFSIKLLFICAFMQNTDIDSKLFPLSFFFSYYILNLYCCLRFQFFIFTSINSYEIYIFLTTALSPCLWWLLSISLPCFLPTTRPPLCVCMFFSHHFYSRSQTSVFNYCTCWDNDLNAMPSRLSLDLHSRRRQWVFGVLCAALWWMAPGPISS